MFTELARLFQHGDFDFTDSVVTFVRLLHETSQLDRSGEPGRPASDSSRSRSG